MFMLLKAVINQHPVPVLRKAINWEALLKECDFHNVLSIVYLGALGVEKSGFKQSEEQFYQKHHKAMLLNNAFERAEQVLMWQLERHHVHAVILSGGDCRELYLRPEMAYPEAVKILLADKDMGTVHQFMRDMDYERQENRMDGGIIYTRIPGLKFIFYTKIPVENKLYRKSFAGSIHKYSPKAGYHFVHILEPEDEYLYTIGNIVELYVRKILKIRDILDYWQFCKGLDDEFEWKFVTEFLQKAKFAEFADQIYNLARMWFDNTEDVQDDEVTLQLEEYILSGGERNMSLGERILPREELRLNFYERDREKEWQLKKRTWYFPPRDYMIQYFPILEHFPFLLVFCWGIRQMRLIKRAAAKKWKEIQDILIRLSHIRSKDKEEDEYAEETKNKK